MESTQPPSPSLAHTKIAFVSDRDGRYEIYVMNPDGTGQRRLTHSIAENGGPAWSPDGTRIAFGSFRDGYHEIHIMHADGTNSTRLTRNPWQDGMFSWSPDGTKIAFGSDPDSNSQHDIYVMNADGTNRVRLTHGTAQDLYPSWSPDGTQIAFSSTRDGHPEIYVMNADGTNQTRLTDGSAGNMEPVWSPDGTKIAFGSDRDGLQEIYVMEADGSNPTRLTCNMANDGHPTWSPDGTKITFTSIHDGNTEIYVMEADGSNPTRLTYNTAMDTAPAWSPFLPAVLPDTLHIVEALARPGGQAIVEVRLSTNQEAAGLQFMVQPMLNDLPTTNASFNGLINNIASLGFTATSATDANGVTTILLFSTDDTTIPPGDRTILQLVYDIAPETPAGAVITLSASEDVLSSSTRQPIPHTLQSSAITVGRPGDLTRGPVDVGIGDGQVDLDDALTVTRIIIGYYPGGRPRPGTLGFFLADVNADGEINVLDVVEIINQTQSGATTRSADSPTTPVSVSLGEVQTTESGQLVVPMMVQTDGVLSGMQAKLTFDPAELRVENPQVTGLASEARVECDLHPDGRLWLVVYNPTGQGIMKGSELTFLIPVTLLRSPDALPMLILNRVALADRQAQMVPVTMGMNAVTVSLFPTAFALRANHPNPFRTSTQIAYDVRQTAHVTLTVCDLHDQELIRLVDEYKTPGRYVVAWDGQDRHGTSVPNGEYLCRMTTSTGFTQARRMRISS